MIAFIFRIFVLSLAAVIVWFLFDFSWTDGELRVQYRFSKPAERIRGFIDEEKQRLAGEEGLPLPAMKRSESDPAEPSMDVPEVTPAPPPKASFRSSESHQPEAQQAGERGAPPAVVTPEEGMAEEEIIPEESRREIEKLIRESM